MYLLGKVKFYSLGENVIDQEERIKIALRILSDSSKRVEWRKAKLMGESNLFKSVSGTCSQRWAADHAYTLSAVWVTRSYCASEVLGHC